jgi:hypothetical protein
LSEDVKACEASKCQHCQIRESSVPVDASGALRLPPGEVERRVQAWTGEGPENRHAVRLIQ